MIVYRLSKRKFAADLSGLGAEKAGGRWNSKGTRLLYTSESRALCTTEIAVHTPLGNIPSDYCLVTLRLPDTTPVLELKPSQLPRDWDAVPHTDATQKIGDRFVKENKYLVMKVPSAVVQGDFNYLVNPSHPMFRKVKVIKTEPFRFDERLFK